MLALSQMAKPGRLFVPLDVNFFDDPRVVGLPIEARDLFLQILCLSKRTMSDGMVTIEQSRRLSTNADALLPHLTDVVLLEANHEAKTYQVVAWGQWNEEANSISERSKIRAEAGRKGGITSGLVRRGELPSKQIEANASSKLEANSKQGLEHRDRVETDTETSKKTTAPPSLELSPSFQQRALANYPGIDITANLEACLDHHRAKGSKFARWDSAFSTWLRNGKGYGTLILTASSNEYHGVNNGDRSVWEMPDDDSAE